MGMVIAGTEIIQELKRLTTVASLIMLQEQELNHTWLYFTGISRKLWKTSTTDGSTHESCELRRFLLPVMNVHVLPNKGLKIRIEPKGWLFCCCYYCRKDFTTYAETCFQKFGDRVKHWITFNEPHTLAIQGYDVGLQAPGRCSILLHLFCRAGNSATEPYIVGHNVLLSHATAVDVYRKKYQVRHKMKVITST